MSSFWGNRISILSVFLFVCIALSAQKSVKKKLSTPVSYGGIEVGAKGVKLSIIETLQDDESGGFKILKDSSVNTDFISFSEPTFKATLNGLHSLYTYLLAEKKLPAQRIYTVISSGVKMQAEKEGKTSLIKNLVDSFKLRISEPGRQVEVVDVIQEATLSHLGIVPPNMRYTTFLIDIGSGNAKGGYFPNETLKDFKLFQVNWGTKSTANAAEKKCENDKSLANYAKQLNRVLAAAENTEITYAVNASGAYPASDQIAISGGIAWAVANLLHPEMTDNTVVPVTYDEVARFCEKIYTNYSAFSENMLSAVNVSNDGSIDRKSIAATIKTIHKVFDQRSLMAGSGLLLKIMRQYASVNESKQFYLIKNGQVGWISAYVRQHTAK